jgi:hypothetical protein
LQAQLDTPAPAITTPYFGPVPERFAIISLPVLGPDNRSSATSTDVLFPLLDLLFSLGR